MTATSRASGRKPRRPVRIVVVVVAAFLLTIGGAWFAARLIATPEPPLDLSDAPATLAADFDPDGQWTPGEGSEAGYRIGESLGGQRVTVVGRTSEVSGTVTIEDGRLTAAEMVVDVAAIVTDESARDAYFRRAMDTSTYPDATFRLTRPVALPDLQDTEAEVALDGTLSMHGVSRPVTVAARVQRTPDGVEVVGQIPLVLEDVGLTAPDLAFVTVDPDGEIEFLLVLTR